MTTTSFFGPGVDTSIFSPDTLGVDGKIRSCAESHTSSNIRWFGFNGVDPAKLSFCEHCAKIGYKDDELFEITDCKYPGLKSTLICDSSKSKFIKQYVGERRCVKYNGIKFNVNITNEQDTIWRPILKMINNIKAQEAERIGVLLANIPSMSYWEYIVQIDEDSEYYSEDYYFKVEAKFGDGRKVIKTDQYGSSNFYTSSLAQFRVNGYSSGKGQRFFFQAPTYTEICSDEVAEHNKKSNILYLNTMIYKKENIEVAPDIKEIKYRGRTSKGGGTQYRGGGGTQYRGASSNHDSLVGGSNFSTSGFSEHASTTRVNARFIHVKKVCTIIQLVNNEDERQKQYMSDLIRKQIVDYREGEIEKLVCERHLIDVKIDELRKPIKFGQSNHSIEDQQSCLV